MALKEHQRNATNLGGSPKTHTHVLETIHTLLWILLSSLLLCLNQCSHGRDEMRRLVLDRCLESTPGLSHTQYDSNESCLLHRGMLSAYTLIFT